LREHVKAKAGEIVTTTGQIIGRHTGLPFYTLGQREGIGLGGAGPYYVVDKNLKTNKLIVTNDKKDKSLWKREFIVSDLSWTIKKPKFPVTAGVSIRYHHPDYSALITKEKFDKVAIKFKEPQRAITPGQSAVIYDNDCLLGGGIIERVL
jgi:tRNA-specific 2-thiouridylase